jgi:hypothetical protein
MRMLAETQRQTLLAAMGIDVYLLRTRDVGSVRGVGRETAKPVQVPSIPAADAAQENIALVVACSRCAGDDTHTARLRAALPLVLGISAGRIGWIETDAGGVLAAPPPAPAYLALGSSLARALGEQLSTMQQKSSVIAVADAPQACLGNALAKRALWQALKPIARHLRRSQAEG